MKKTLIFLLTASVNSAFAQWNANTSINTPVAITSKSQSNLHSTTDRVGGSIIVWDDSRNSPGNSSDIYAQRMDKNGIAKWTLNGKAISSYTATQRSVSIVDAEDGSSIITWEDSRAGNYDIYAQKIDSSGNTLWTTDGIAVCTKTTTQKNPKIISDKAGGAIIVWEDSVSFYWDVTAQRINNTGILLWSIDGSTICNASNNQINPKIDTDGNSGAIITWQDKRNGFDYDIYAQRIDPNGSVQWAANGVVVCNALNAQTGPRIEPDGANGAFIAWIDKRNGTDYDVYAQRINSSGISEWATNGIVICNAPNNQSALDIKHVGSAGLMMAWKDSRSGLEKIYVQLTSITGLNQMATNGVVISNSLKSLNPNIISDGLGGGIVAWEDSVGTEWNITSQKINSTGTVEWPIGGVTVSNATNHQVSVSQVTDGNGGAIYVWEDKRNTNDYDVYAQHLYSDGAPVIGLNEIQSQKMTAVCYPNPITEKSIIKLINCPENINFELNIYDVFGKIIVTKSLKHNESYSISDADLSPGNYYFEIKKDNYLVFRHGKLILINE